MGGCCCVVWQRNEQEGEAVISATSSSTQKVADVSERDFLAVITNVLQSEKEYMLQDERLAIEPLPDLADGAPSPRLPSEAGPEAKPPVTPSHRKRASMMGQKEKDNFVAGYTLGTAARVLVDYVLNQGRLMDDSASTLAPPVNIEEEAVQEYRNITLDHFSTFLNWEAKLRVENKLR